MVSRAILHGAHQPADSRESRYDDDFVQEYEDEWLRLQNLTNEEQSALLEDEQLFDFSVDLEEATYRIPFEVLDENIKVFDEVMKDFKPYTVFRDLFTTHERVVDMTELVKKGFWNGPNEVISTRGSFMGDGLSFIHLTLLLQGLLRGTLKKEKCERPIGQSVGDDLFTFKTKLKVCMRFCALAEKLGCKFSKLNSISEDTSTFCEQYTAVVNDLDEFKDNPSMKGSIFGDHVFLDIIKGSILGGQSKVSASGSDPFIGHANMLNKQVAWHPDPDIKKRSKTFLWSANYMSAKRMASGMASLPIELGGVDLCVGESMEYDSVRFKAYLPYYERMLTLDERDFLKFSLLLRGIYQANPKGYKWENDAELISTITKDCVLFKHDEVMETLPNWAKSGSTRETLSYIGKTLGYVSFFELSQQIARQDSFKKAWDGVKPDSRVTLHSRNSKERSNKVWAYIKGQIDPLDKSLFKSTNMRTLASAFRARTWGLWVSKQDPIIKSAFDGTPQLNYPE
jgi:hypothetical protein